MKSGLCAKLAGSIMGLIALAAGAAEPLVAEKGVTVMSPFEVAALSSEFAGWSKHGSAHFTLYTDTDAEDAGRILRTLEVRRWAEEKFFGRNFPRAAPRIIVLPTESSDWKRLESKTNVEWRVAVSNSGRSVGPLSVTQYDWQERGLGVLHGGLASAGLRPLDLGAALWFEWGVKDFFETVEVTTREVRFGDPNRRRTTEVLRDGWLAWPRFFAVTPSSPEFIRADGIGRYEGQCAVFVHSLLTNPDPVWRERLMIWRARCGPGHEPTEAEFKEVFGESWKDWQRRMEVAARDENPHRTAFPIPDELKEIPVESFDLKTREMRDLFVLVQLTNQDVPASVQALDSLLRSGLKTESLRRLLVAASLEKGREPAALEQLRAMVAAGWDYPQAHLEAARILFNRAVARVSVDARLGSEAGEIVALCARALELEPRLREAAEFYAWARALGPECTPGDAKALATFAVKLDAQVPRERVVGALAVALWRSGDPAGAKVLTGQMKRAASVGPTMRELAAALEAKLDEAKP